MANLLRENDPIKPWLSVDIPPGSPQATNQVYLSAITPLALKHGAFRVAATDAHVIVPGEQPPSRGPHHIVGHASQAMTSGIGILQEFSNPLFAHSAALQMRCILSCPPNQHGGFNGSVTSTATC